MTLEADRIRTRRQVFAQPGSVHDRLVKLLGVVLPVTVGLLAAFMVLAPLTPRGEVSFLLDKNAVDVAPERLRVANAMYRGEDDQGRAFSLKAGSAVQRTSRVPVVEMEELSARILLSGGPAVLQANRGAYDMDTDKVEVSGPVVFEASGGYRLLTRDVDIDMKTRQMLSRGQVEGRVPAGTFRADRLRADLEARTVTLDGNARLRMTPGRMRMP